MSIPHTRAIIDGIHSGALNQVEYQTDPVFGVQIPTSCPGVPSDVLIPSKAWSDSAAYQAAASKLASLFRENFNKYADQASAEVLSAAPK